MRRHIHLSILTLLGPQSRFGDKLLIFRVNCPQIWECGSKRGKTVAMSRKSVSSSRYRDRTGYRSSPRLRVFFPTENKLYAVPPHAENATVRSSRPTTRWTTSATAAAIPFNKKQKCPVPCHKQPSFFVPCEHLPYSHTSLVQHTVGRRNLDFGGFLGRVPGWVLR